MISKTALKAKMITPSKNYALVTGASSGLGWHLSERLAELGYALIAVSNQPSGLEDLKKHLEQNYQFSVVTINMDLAKENSARDLFDQCEEQNLQVDILINNAGMLVYGEVISVEYPQAQSILHLHMTTPALLCRLFGEKMATRRQGYILNVSSISAVMPYPTISFYGPSKTFIRHFSRALRTELKPSGVTVTCLIPGAMDTPLHDPYDFNRNLAKKLGVFKNPDIVAHAGIKALLRNRAECKPGLLNKLSIWLLPFVPHFIIGLMYRRSRHQA
jgi:short-subunit dehydrogenase